MFLRPFDDKLIESLLNLSCVRNAHRCKYRVSRKKRTTKLAVNKLRLQPFLSTDFLHSISLESWDFSGFSGFSGTIIMALVGTLREQMKKWIFPIEVCVWTKQQCLCRWNFKHAYVQLHCVSMVFCALSVGGKVTRHRTAFTRWMCVSGDSLCGHNNRLCNCRIIPQAFSQFACNQPSNSPENISQISLGRNDWQW